MSWSLIISIWFLIATRSTSVGSCIEDNSLDVITLRERIAPPQEPDRLSERRAAAKAEAGWQGDRRPNRISVVLSSFIFKFFKYLHHEPVGFTISEPELDECRGAAGLR